MAAPKKVSVTYAFGRRDRVDPKLAPFGVLKIGRNLRIRKDGRLGARNGFQPLVMTTLNGDLEAYDLHDYRGRLLALGSDGGDNYPTELFEYIGLADVAAWRGTDPNGQRITLNPFTNLREVAGTPLDDGGSSFIAAAAGGGYVCVVLGQHVVIVDAATDQVVHSEKITDLIGTVSVRAYRVIYAGGVFYLAVNRTPGGTFHVRIYKFEVGVDSAFALFATVVSTAGIVTPYDIVPVTNPGSARLAVAYSLSGTVSIVVYDGAGAQVGSTINVSATAELVSLVSDQTDNTHVLYIREPASVGSLRTYNFAGALIAGPTATTTGAAAAIGSLCRLPAQVGFIEHVAVIVNDASLNAVVQYFAVDTHALTATTTIQRAVATGRAVSGQSESHPMAIAFPAVIGPDLDTFENATNALFFVTPTTAHTVTRDLRTARVASDAVHLARDDSEGHLIWAARRDPGIDIASAVFTLVDFQSQARREAAPYGGLLYFAGATPAVYDGRFVVEQSFNEFPSIISSSTSGASGDLTPGATYSYVAHWEYVTADGSVVQSPVSDPFDVTMPAGQTRVTLVVQCPHTVRTALGDALYGADVSVVISRTVWEPVSSTQGSIFRRCESTPASTGMSNYGRTINITDGEADDDIADNAAIYTQAERGVISAPLQHFAPQSCNHVTATESRLLHGGLARTHEVQVSKGSYLGEPFSFSPFSQYFSQVAGPVRGVRHLDGVKLVFTADRVYAIGGDGPDDVGVGALDYPREIPSPGGLANSWSFLDAPDGLWFQLDDSKLYRMPRGGGAPTWEGIDVHDTLTEYPVITGACKHRADSAGIFACSNESGTDARFLVRDFRTEQWFEDEPFITSDGFGIEALTSFGDTIAYLSAGVVYHQVAGNFTDGAGVFISTMARTHPLYPFGVGGYGQIYELLLTGEYRDHCLLECRVSYDDGLTFTGLESFNLVDLTPGQTIQRKWTLPQDITSSVVIEFATSEAIGGRGPTEGFVFNQVDLLVGPEDGLRELTPDEMA